MSELLSRICYSCFYVIYCSLLTLIPSIPLYNSYLFSLSLSLSLSFFDVRVTPVVLLLVLVYLWQLLLLYIRSVVVVVDVDVDVDDIYYFVTSVISVTADYCSITIVCDLTHFYTAFKIWREGTIKALPFSPQIKSASSKAEILYGTFQ